MGIEGIEVAESLEGSIVLRSSSEQKNPLLRRLLDMNEEIGSVQRISKSLEDLYMEYVEGAEDA